MKLAEALMLRADMQKKIASLRERIGRNALVQEGDSPHEDPSSLIKESFAIMGELEGLVANINRTNATVKIGKSETLTEAISRRDTIAAQHSLLQHAISSTTREPDRYSMAEIKWVATLKVADLQKQSDKNSKSLRELNASIQEANWNVDLIEN